MAKKSIEPSTLINDRYVIGVTWRAIINRGSMSALAKKRAKEEVGANYYTHFGDQKYVGAALIKSVPSDGEMFALAKILTGRVPSFGFNLTCLQIELDTWWVCVIEGGIPRFDKVVRGEDEVRKVFGKYKEDAQEAGIQVFSDGSLEFHDTQSMSFGDITAGYDEESKFQSLKTKTDPKIFALLGLVVVAGGGFFGWTYYNKIKAEEEAARRAAEEAAAALSPEQVAIAWKKQVDKFFFDRKVVDHEGLTDLRNVLLNLPTKVGGWQTNTFACALSVPNWKCLSTFVRAKNLEFVPTNKSLMDAKPPGWEVAFKGLGEAQISFAFPAFLRGLDRADTVTLNDFKVDSVSLVQTYANYVSTLSLSDPAKEKIPAPTAPNGTPIDPIPAQPSEVAKFDVAITAPLRNTYLFDANAPKIFWNSVELRADPVPIPRADFRTSNVTVTIKGQMYAVDR